MGTLELASNADDAFEGLNFLFDHVTESDAEDMQFDFSDSVSGAFTRAKRQVDDTADPSTSDDDDVPTCSIVSAQMQAVASDALSKTQQLMSSSSYVACPGVPTVP